MRELTANLYDFPRYYDLVYGSDWKAEFDFLQGCFARHVKGPVKSLFEPACGTGRLLFRLAAAGYRVAGNDLNAKAVAYCNQRLERRGFPATAKVQDMSDFRLRRPVDAAFNTINSFRHLASEAQAVAHLRCMASAVRPGGIYVLGLHLTPQEGEPIEEEAWSARRGHLGVNSRMWVVERNLKQRIERCQMVFDVYTPTDQFRIRDEVCFRTYTARQLTDLIAAAGGWELAATYDFAYDLEDPIEIDASTEDVVCILRATG